MNKNANRYDVLIIGTGLSECILAAALARSGQKVLHIDQNKHYGSEVSVDIFLKDILVI